MWNSRKWKVVLVGFAALVGGAIFLASSGIGSMALEVVHRLPAGDKLLHFGLMGLLALLANFAFPRARLVVRELRLTLPTLVVLIVATLEEWSQVYLAARTFSWRDLLANYAGILLFGWLARWRLDQPRGRASAWHG